MPKTIKITCDVCGKPLDKTHLEYKMKWDGILYHVTIPLIVGRIALMDKDQSTYKMPKDYLCEDCTLIAIKSNKHDTL